MKNIEENGRKIFLDKNGNISTTVVKGNILSIFHFILKNTEKFFTGKNELGKFEGLIYGKGMFHQNSVVVIPFSSYYYQDCHLSVFSRLNQISFIKKDSCAISLLSLLSSTTWNLC